jgi:hypothetical protein
MEIAMGRRSSARTGPKVGELTLVAATCGKYLYSATSTDEPIKFHLDSDMASPSCQSGQDLTWLELSKQSVLNVKHSNSRSPIVVIRRSNPNRVNGPYVLKFRDITDASLFIAWLHGVSSMDEVYP